MSFKHLLCVLLLPGGLLDYTLSCPVPYPRQLSSITNKVSYALADNEFPVSQVVACVLT